MSGKDEFDERLMPPPSPPKPATPTRLEQGGTEEKQGTGRHTQFSGYVVLAAMVAGWLLGLWCGWNAWGS